MKPLWPSSIRRRMELGVAGLIIPLVMAGAVGWWATGQLAHTIRDTLRVVQTGALIGSRLAAVITEEQQVGAGYVDFPSPARERRFRELGAEARHLHAQMALQGAANVEEALLTAGMVEDLNLIESSYARAHRLRDLGRTVEARRELEYVRPWLDRMQVNQQRLNGLKAERVARASERLQRATERRAWLLISLLLATALGVAVWGRLGINSISDPLRTLIDHAEELSRENLDATTPTDGLPDEFAVLAEAMNRAGTSLGRLRVAEAALFRTEKLRALGMLVSGVAHELNNPLAAILLSAEELRLDMPPGADTEALRTIHEQALRSRDIVRNLLAAVGERHVRREPIDTRALIERTARLLDQQVREREAELRLHLDPSLPPVFGDRAALQQVLVNLIMNAAQATGPGGIIDVRASCDGISCFLVVEDNGPGIPPEGMQRLFEPFFTTKPVGEGTGLGLSVSLGIIEQHGGTIQVANRAEGGARFVVTLPVAHDGARPEGLEPAPPAELRAEPAAAAGRPALIIDDEEPIRSVLHRFFRRLGYQVDLAEDGAVGLERIRAAERAGESYAVIISDLKMPNLSGPELHDRLVEEHPDLVPRTIFCTGDVTSSDVAQFVRRTQRPVLQKPFEFGSLKQAVESVDPGALAAGSAG